MNAKERDALIAHQFIEENKTAPELSVEFGLSVARIYQVLNDQGVKRGPEPRQRTKTDGTRAFSQMHVNLGLKLYSFRQFEKSNTRDQAAEELNWSVKKVALIEKGEMQLTLNDLLQLAKYLDRPLSELILDCEDIGNGATE